MGRALLPSQQTRARIDDGALRTLRRPPERNTPAVWVCIYLQLRVDELVPAWLSRVASPYSVTRLGPAHLKRDRTGRYIVEQ